jgi:hypothetical protein
MTEQPVGPRCGNNPNFRMTPGDRKAVDDFKARLALQASAKPYIDNAAWTDGDPLMEVIAVTLWKHCARDDRDMPQLVCDDPRTIAAFAAAVARAHAASGVVAVAVPPTGQTATLTDAERTMLTYALDQAQEHIWSRDGFTDEDQAAVTSLRRLADEAQQQPETEAGCAHCGGPHSWDGCEAYTTLVAADAPRCDVEFENGARCGKPAGHRPTGSDDPHVPVPAVVSAAPPQPEETA